MFYMFNIDTSESYGGRISAIRTIRMLTSLPLTTTSSLVDSLRSKSPNDDIHVLVSEEQLMNFSRTFGTSVDSVEKVFYELRGMCYNWTVIGQIAGQISSSKFSDIIYADLTSGSPSNIVISEPTKPKHVGIEIKKVETKKSVEVLRDEYISNLSKINSLQNQIDELKRNNESIESEVSKRGFTINL